MLFVDEDWASRRGQISSARGDMRRRRRGGTEQGESGTVRKWQVDWQGVAKRCLA